MNLQKLGKPDFELLGLQLWILSRQFPNATDYWDSNWMFISACCTAPCSRVYAQGSFLHLSELHNWLKQMKILYKKSHGTAELDCMEPNLYVKITLNHLGSGKLIVKLTPDHLTQKHEVEFEIDQSYLPKAIKNLESIMNRFPLRK